MAAFIITNLLFGYSLSLFVLAMFGIAFFVFMKPEIGVPVVIVLTMLFENFFTLQPLILSQDISYKIYPLDMVILITFAAAIISSLVGSKRRKIYFGFLDLWLLAFMSATFVYFIVSAQGSGDFELAFSAFKNYSFYALLYFLIVFLVQNKKDYFESVNSFLIGGVGVIFFIIIGLLRREGLWTDLTPLSTEGTRTLAFAHAFYSSMVLLMIVALANFKVIKSKALVFSGMWIYIAGLMGSLMRHIWIAIAVSATALFVTFPQKARAQFSRFAAQNVALMVIVLSMILLGAVLFPLSEFSRTAESAAFPLYSRVRSLIAATGLIEQSAFDVSTNWRLFAWRAARDSFVANPITGIFFGKELLVDFGSYRLFIPIRDLHNSYLVLLVQMGLIGSMLFIFINMSVVLRFWQWWWRSFAKRKLEKLDYYNYAMMALYINFMVAAFFQPYFEVNFTGIFYWIILGYISAGLRLSKQSRTT